MAQYLDGRWAQNRVEAPEEEQDMFSGEEGKAPPGSGIAALLAHSMGAPPSPITPSALSRSSHHRLMVRFGITRSTPIALSYGKTPG